MSRTALVLAALALPTLAGAQEPGQSNSEIVTFTGERALFDGVEQEFGFDLFDETLSVKATADFTSVLSFVMDGRSDLDWPETLENRWDQISEPGGTITLDNDFTVKLVGEVNFGGTRFGATLWEEGLDWSQTFELRSILLEDTRQGATALLRADGADLVAFSETITISEDNDIYVTIGGTAKPSATVDVTALGIESGDGVATSPASVNMVSPPGVNDGFVDFMATWLGEVQSSAGITLTPSVRVDIGSSYFGPLEYPFTVDLFNDQPVPLVSAPSQVSHDLPAVVPGARTLDFGQVVVGDASTREFIVENLGDVELTGQARVEGDAFALAEGTLLLPRTNEAGPTSQTLTLDFLPPDIGSFTGTLILTTNDPVEPEIEIPMVGAGVEPPSDDEGNGDSNDVGNGDGLVEQPGSGCGCATTTPGGSALALGLLGLVGLVARRRRTA
jgi:MYXO-CTERM domain-containing protein